MDVLIISFLKIQDHQWQ